MPQPCSKCGKPFEVPQSRGGRRRTRCDRCRDAHSAIDGTKWRSLRKKMLAGNPPCQICFRAPATQLDHIVPLARGGHPYDPANLQVACSSCNARKRARIANFGPDSKVPDSHELRPANPVRGGSTPATKTVVREYLDGNARVTVYGDGSEERRTAIAWCTPGTCNDPLHVHDELRRWSL